MQRLLIGCVAAVMALSPAPASAQADKAGGFTLSGIVKFKKTGTILLELLTEAQYERIEGGQEEHDHSNEASEDMTGQLRIAVGDEEKKQGQVSFEFKNVPPGVYAIQGFLDLNGNDELDEGRFGPREPWGNYRSSRPAFRGPKFPELRFEVNQDIANIVIEMK